VLDRAVTIGNGFDNDLVLNTVSAEDWRIELSGETGDIELSVVAGEIEVGRESLESGQTLRVVDSATVRKDQTHFTVTAVAVNESVVADTHLRTEKASARPRQGLFMRRVGVLLLACLAAGFCVAGAILLTGSGNLKSAVATEALGWSMKDSLKLHGLDNLQYRPASKDEAARLTGYVRTRAEKNKVLELAQDADPLVIVNVQDNESFADSIEDIYRVNGVSASVEVMGIGEARVTTNTADTDTLRRIETILKSDLRQLKTLHAENTVPPVQQNPVLVNDPDKEVSLIVGGEAGYIVTRDLSRYFVGSIMPNGYEIVEINEGSVVISRDGQEMKLQF
jgi:type III secretion protein D